MTDNIYRTKVYVYGILNEKDEIIYVGKTTTPKRRLADHKRTTSYNKLKILDTFFDTEFYWIEKLKTECKLENKFDRPDEEDWEIGDIVVVEDLKKVAVLDTETSKEYETIAEASKDLDISRNRIRYSVYKSKKRFILL